MSTAEMAGNGESPVGVVAPGYRLPAELRLGKVVLQISDLERSLAYYTAVLGLEVIRRESDAALLGAAGREIVELREKRGVSPVPRRGLLGLYHFAILLPDRASLGRFLMHLGEMNVRAGASDHLVSEAPYLNDPDGLGIEVYADRPREIWSYDTARQVTMTTLPLDTGALIRSAGQEKWSGAPEGTTLGHVHLHVGDVEVAGTFYHEALGLDKIVWNYPGALFMSAGGYHHHLGVNSWAADARSAADMDARLLEWEIVLPSTAEVERALASLEGSGVAVERTAESGAALDPWGTQLRLSAVPAG